MTTHFKGPVLVGDQPAQGLFSGVPMSVYDGMRSYIYDFDFASTSAYATYDISDTAVTAFGAPIGGLWESSNVSAAPNTNDIGTAGTHVGLNIEVSAATQGINAAPTVNPVNRKFTNRPDTDMFYVGLFEFSNLTGAHFFFGLNSNTNGPTNSIPQNSTGAIGAGQVAGFHLQGSVDPKMQMVAGANGALTATDTNGGLNLTTNTPVWLGVRTYKNQQVKYFAGATRDGMKCVGGIELDSNPITQGMWPAISVIFDTAATTVTINRLIAGQLNTLP